MRRGEKWTRALKGGKGVKAREDCLLLYSTLTPTPTLIPYPPAPYFTPPTTHQRLGPLGTLGLCSRYKYFVQVHCAALEPSYCRVVKVRRLFLSEPFVVRRTRRWTTAAKGEDRLGSHLT